MWVHWNDWRSMWAFHFHRCLFTALSQGFYKGGLKTWPELNELTGREMALRRPALVTELRYEREPVLQKEKKERKKVMWMWSRWMSYTLWKLDKMRTQSWKRHQKAEARKEKFKFSSFLNAFNQAAWTWLKLSNMPEDQKWNCWQVQTGVCAPAVEASSLTPNTEHKQELSGPRGAVKPPVVLFFWCAGQFSGAESIYGVHILCVSSVRGKATTSRSKQPVRSTLINKCN